MKTKQIVFVAPNQVELLERELPALKNKEVLIRLAVSTISSGTERANLVGNPNVHGGTRLDASFPRYLGYSSAGEVVAVGEDVTAFRAGDRVALSWSVHSQYVILPEDYVHHMPEALSYEEAAIGHIGTFPLAAIRKCHLEIGESAIVMGLGVLGLMAVQQLRAAGAVPVIAVDPKPEKREFALRLGADYALNPMEEDFAAQVKKLTGGGANVAIEVTGIGQGLNMVLDCMARHGRVALLGCTRSSDFTVDYYAKVHAPGISLIGAHTHARPIKESSAGLWTHHDDIMAIMRMATMGRIDLKALIQETHSPLACKEVYHRLVTEPTFPIVQFDWRQI